MRKYLDSSREKIIPLSDELELLNLYTELESLRFEGLFSVEIHVGEKISIEDTYLPSMLIQPFVENAIIHGLTERRVGNGSLKIEFYQSESFLICDITDNGIGRVKSKESKRKGHISRGMQMIKDRVHSLRQSALADISIDIKENEPENVEFPGTHIRLHIKNLEDEDL